MARDLKKKKNKSMKKQMLVLGSASPRRRELLAPYFKMRVVAADIDETPRRSEKPVAYVKRMAHEKFQALSARYRDSDLLTADTVVILGSRILGKPESRQDARKMLAMLSGKKHLVVTAVQYRRRGVSQSFVCSTSIGFRSLSKREIEDYLKSQEWRGKAGSYAIQGLAQKFVQEIRGSLTNVIGLPLERILKIASSTSTES